MYILKISLDDQTNDVYIGTSIAETGALQGEYDDLFTYYPNKAISFLDVKDAMSQKTRFERVIEKNRGRGINLEVTKHPLHQIIDSLCCI